MLDNIKNATRLFVFSVILNLLLFIIFENSLDTVYYSIIRIYSSVPITTTSIFFVNMCSMLIVYGVGKQYMFFTDFVITLNGAMLGIFISLYKGTLSLLSEVLIPHVFFETAGIILLCASVKTLAQASSKGDKPLYQKAHAIIGIVCIPLFLISLFLEVY